MKKYCLIEDGLNIFVKLEKVKKLDRENYFIIRDEKVDRNYFTDFTEFGAANISKKMIGFDNIYSFIYNNEKRTLDIFYGNMKNNEKVGEVEISI